MKLTLLYLSVITFWLVSCKKQEITTAFTVTDANGLEHHLKVNPSDPNRADLSIIYYHPPQPINLPAYYSIMLHLDDGNSQNNNNEINLNIPSLQMKNTGYDTTYYFNVFNSIKIDGITYFSNGITINNISVSMTPHVWQGEPMINYIASGSLDLSIDAVSSQNINGNIIKSNALNKKILIKGAFKDIFANQ
jgi:hypothetical protein